MCDCTHALKSFSRAGQVERGPLHCLLPDALSWLLVPAGPADAPAAAVDSAAAGGRRPPAALLPLGLGRRHEQSGSAVAAAAAGSAAEGGRGFISSIKF